MDKPRKKQAIPKPRDMRISEGSYQPSRAELREEIDMPRLSLKQARAAFARPFRFLHNKTK